MNNSIKTLFYVWVALIVSLILSGCGNGNSSLNSTHTSNGKSDGIERLFSKLDPLSCPCSTEDAKAAQQNASKILGLPESINLALSDNVQMKFVLIPPGSFLFSEGQEIHHQSGRRYQVERPFYMAAMELTYEQFLLFASFDKVAQVERKIEDPLLPAELNAWRECDRFIVSIQKKLGLVVRLPTELEWEYACRAGTKGPYGDLKVNREGLGHFVSWNMVDDESKPKYGNDLNVKLIRGGQFPANAWGIHDALGSAKELCADSHKEASHGTGIVVQVVLAKGGNVINSHGFFRREHTAAPVLDPFTGLRLVLEIDDRLVMHLKETATNQRRVEVQKKNP